MSINEATALYREATAPRRSFQVGDTCQLKTLRPDGSAKTEAAIITAVRSDCVNVRVF